MNANSPTDPGGSTTASSRASSTTAAREESLDLAVSRSESDQPLIRRVQTVSGAFDEASKEEDDAKEKEPPGKACKMLEKKRKALSDLRKTLSLSVTPEKGKKASLDRGVLGGDCGDGPGDPLANLTEEEYVKLLHFCVWPCSKYEHFVDMVARRPETVHSRFGVQQETLMHRACRYGNHRVFHFLVEKGAVLTARNKMGATPLHLACQFDRMDMIRTLVSSGAPLDDVDEHGDQAVHFSAKAGSERAINFFLERGVDRCVPGHRNNTIIHYAAAGGNLELVGALVDGGCGANKTNGLTETPLHMLCRSYHLENDHGIDVARRLLAAGADLGARTVWGDTPAHYCGRWSGHELLEFLLESGAHVEKPKDVCIHPNFYKKWSVSADEQEDFELSLLQKVAKSACVIKAHLVIERIMKARNKLATNMYYGNRGIELGQHSEMNNQELSFLAMSREMIVCQESNMSAASNNVAGVNTTKVGGGGAEDGTGRGAGCSAIEMFLKYSPDSLNRLFDLCVCKPCLMQVQGKVYFDFFLFDPHSSDRSASELHLINLLINSGKERLLIHPIFETFLKLKWYRCWYFYLLYVLLDLTFLISLGGFTLAHFGQLYEGQGNWEYGTRNGWWWFLAGSHVYSTGFTAARLFQMCGYLKSYCVRNSKVEHKRTSTIDRSLEALLFTLKNVITPILIGLTLYGNFDQKMARYFLSFSIILSCYHFMTVISRMPRIGLYVNMLSKVMMTVLNFFASYVWHFLGYAIAFHILLPDSGPFAIFTDSFIKVMTMLMGEYDYTLNFVANPNSSYIAKIVFAVFVVDMSVVLMNLVLGLAVSDIEELQRNSAVRRMMQETSGVDFMENLFQVLCMIPGCHTFFSPRITNNKSTNFEDVVYLDLVDLDKSPSNCIILESQTAVGPKQDCYSCPHHIVQKVAAILKEEIRARRLAKPDLETGLQQMSKIRDTQALIVAKLVQLEKSLSRSAGQQPRSPPPPFGVLEQQQRPTLARGANVQ